MREVVLDTETTGLDPASGHRIVEMGAVELLNHLPTGLTYHQYINPERDMPEEAFRIHNLSEDFLADFPVFADVYQSFSEFIRDSRLIIHNAPFDLKFINAEFRLLGITPLSSAQVVDTLTLAQRRFPGAPVSLDALCRRFGVDASARTRHGALLDSELLAECYLELIGGRQTNLALTAQNGSAVAIKVVPKERREPRSFPLHEGEIERHAAFVADLKNAVWSR